MAGIVESCIAAGCNKEELLSDYADGLELFADPKNISTTQRFPCQMLHNVLSKAERLCHKPEIGLLCGQNIRPEALSDLGHALMYCENLRQVIEINIRYQALTQQLGKSRLIEKGEKAILLWQNYQVDTENPQQDDSINRLIIDMVMAGHAGFGRWLTWTHNKQIVAVHFRHARPVYAALYEKIFDCPVLFEQDDDAMIIMREDLDMPLPQSNPELLREARLKLDTALSRMDMSISYSELVSRVLQTSMLGNSKTLDKVAFKLGTSPRSLRRRLEEEGTNFSSVLAASRKAICVHHLKRGLPMAVISERLGYSQPSAFNRAFKSWFNMTPQQFTNIKEQADKVFDLLAP